MVLVDLYMLLSVPVRVFIKVFILKETLVEDSLSS